MNGKLILSLCFFFFAGCNSSSDDLELTSVSGKITYQEEPILDGVIRLIPVQGNQAPVRTTQIKSGRYQFKDRSAVKPGSYKIEINAYRGGSSLPGDQTKSSPEREQFLPAEFNTKTEIEELIVVPDRNEIQHDLNLE